MKHIGNEVEKLLFERGIKKKDFADQLEMSDVNLSKVLKKASVDALLLEKISTCLNISASYFFEDKSPNVGHKVSGSGNKVNGNISMANCESDLEKAKLEIEYLKKVLEEKERTISVLMGNKAM